MIEPTADAYRLVLDVYAQTRALPDAWVLLSVIARRLDHRPSSDAITLAQTNGWLEVSGQRVRLLPRGRALFKSPLSMRLVRRERRSSTLGRRARR